jgi:hypothetical protein
MIAWLIATCFMTAAPGSHAFRSAILTEYPPKLTSKMTQFNWSRCWNWPNRSGREIALSNWGTNGDVFLIRTTLDRF